MSDIKQGVTLEVFGEGWSPGPRMKQPKDTTWGTLGEYFRYLEKKKVSLPLSKKFTSEWMSNYETYAEWETQTKEILKFRGPNW